MDKRTTEAAAVAELRDGMTIGIGGWGSRRKPMSIVREILRSPVKDLTLVTYGGPDVGLLCKAGKVRRLVYGFVSLDSIPLEPHFRAARQAGAIPEVRELDEGMLQWGLYAAAIRLPFLPTRAGLGTSVMEINPELKTVRSPYADGEELVAMPALPLDVAFVHMNRADARGNAQYLGPDFYFDDLYCMAAKRRFVSCEKLVETKDLLAEGSLHTLRINRTHGGRRDRDAGRRALHRVPARLRPRRGVPARVRGEREGRRGLEEVPRGVARRARGGVPEEGSRAGGEVMDATRAEICATAVADGFRGDGEILVSCFGTMPSMGARLAKLTFEPELLLTDGIASLVENVLPVSGKAPAAVIESWVPFRSIFDLLWGGRRHVMMMASQIDRFGNQNFACIGPHAKPKAQLLGMRGAPGNTISHAPATGCRTTRRRCSSRRSMWCRASATTAPRSSAARARASTTCAA